MRESSAMKIIDLLAKKGALIDYSDPHIPVFTATGNNPGKLKSIAITAKTISRYDCAVLITNHDAFDYELIKRHAKLIADSRGIYLSPAKNNVKA
jgi:UDP-N-acetyl-D-glucosamine dehydrogenase